MILLTSSQRTWLFKQAHSLSPVIQIGQHGMTEGVIKAVASALADHELIKVKFMDFKEEKKELSEQLATQLNAVIVKIVGHVLVLYKPQPDPDKRNYKLPR